MAHKIQRAGGFLVIALSTAGAAAANPAASYAGEFERPYGFGYSQEERTFDANSRDLNNNRIIIDGRILVGDDLSTLSQTGVFSYRHQFSGAGRAANSRGGTAVGNQLNVITQGSRNIIVVDSDQVNEGDQTIVLNGELDLND